MRIRQALVEEATTIARVGTRAFAQDPSYGHFYPWRDYFPDEFFLHQLNKYMRLMVTPGCMIMVAELEEADAKEDTNSHDLGKIVGFATFQRSGGTQEDQDKWGADNAEKKLHRCCLDLCEAINVPNRAVSEEALNDFWSQELVGHDSTEYTDKLDFYTLAILPEYQRCGFGARLFQWAIMRSTQDNVPIFGDASKKAVGLYTRLGCKVIGNIVQEETTYDRVWCGQKLPSMHVGRWETPIVRWDAGNISQERLEEMMRAATLDSNR